MKPGPSTGDNARRAFTIRSYRRSDDAAVRELHEVALRQVGAFVEGEHGKRWDADLDDIEGTYLTTGGLFLIGELNGEVVAMGALRVLDEHTGEIKRMRVRPDHQRRGYGRAVLCRIEEFAAEHGLHALVLDTAPVQQAARAMYVSAGYVQTGRAQRNGFDLIFMAKRIPSVEPERSEPPHANPHSDVG